MRRLLARLIERALALPLVFELQQRLNAYDDVKAEFKDYLAGGGKTILDLGCSTGNCAAHILDMAANDYTGIDIHPGYTETAQRKYPAGRFRAMDGRALDFPGGHFDLVTIISVLHHMPDAVVADCLKEVRRVMKPGGRTLLIEPVTTPGWWMSNFLLSLDRGRFIRPPEGYRAFLGGFGFERERFCVFGPHRFASYVLTKNP
jgi:ubiquinone/menaquinone biosynthesis C-methylase UbiE